MKKLLGILVLSLLLSSNAYALFKFGKEILPIITVPSGAQCELKNNKGTWSVVTPGEVTVKRSKKPLTITCIKDGFRKFTKIYSLKDERSILGNDQLGSDLSGAAGTALAGDLLTAGVETALALVKVGTYATNVRNGKGYIYIKLFKDE